MATLTFTDEQAQAIGARDVSVSLAAGAGCGKTFVLTERFLAELEPGGQGAPDPAQLQALVAITFTDAAAREMRDRIRRKCYDRLQTAAAAEADYWLRLLRAMETARISTIHSFCASLLRDYAVEADVDPNFGVLEQSDADVLRSEVIDDVLRSELATQREETLHLVAARDFRVVKQQVDALLSAVQRPEGQAWLDRDVEDVLAAWENCYRQRILPLAAETVADSPHAATILELLADLPTPTKATFKEARSVLLELLPTLRDSGNVERDLQLVRENTMLQGVCTKKDWPDGELYKRYSAACQALRKLIEKQLGEWNREELRTAAAMGLEALRLAARVDELYTRQKQAQGKLDFDDLLLRTDRLLSDDEHAHVRQQLSSRLQLVLVDEFQDTNQLQVNLVRALCGDAAETDKLFFVGDFKQSIYRFRGAEPRVFHELRANVRKEGRLSLTDNFRSQPAVLDFVNTLFDGAFVDEYEPLHPRRAQTTERPAVEFLWTLPPADEPSGWANAEAARQAEARRIARRLRQIIDSGERLVVDQQAERRGEPSARPVELKDIALLFRALSDVRLYEEALREYELDYYLVGGHAFYSQQEILDLLQLLRSVQSSCDEISLAGALRSPFFSLEDETLFWLVQAAGSLNRAIATRAIPPQLASAERSKVAAAADTLAVLRAQKDRLPIAALITEALQRTGYDASLLGEFLGVRKLANLHKLLEQARAADEGGVVNLAGFITQLAEFTTRDAKEALAATCPETANVIRLMTIHHAKGLEFPLVVVPDLGRKSSLRLGDAEFHPELGPLVDPPDSNQTTGKALFRMLETREEAEERMRLLYVATTRAADHLILSSSLEAYDKPASDWMQHLASRFDLETGALQEGATGPALVRVVGPEAESDRKPSGKSRGPDLLKLVECTEQAAAAGRDRVPAEAAVIPPNRAARRQFSFSLLSGQLKPRQPEQADDEPPATTAIDPLGLGLLVHEVLERVRFDGDNRLADWCDELAAQHVPACAADAARLAEDITARWLDSPRAAQLAEAREVHREIEFLLAWPPGEQQAAGQFLSGFIDCLYQDPRGNWHVLDYKTNDIPAAAAASEAQRYEMQLGVYALAAERALGAAPVELVLAWLRPGVEHVMPWNQSARQRTIEQVNLAIAKIVAGSDAS